MARDNERPDRDNAGAGRRGADRNSSGRPANNDREGKKIFNRRDKSDRPDDRGDRGNSRSFGSGRRDNERRDSGERRSFNSDRPNREGGERRSFNSDRPDRREGGERRFFGDRKEGGERRSFNGDRPERREGGEKRSYGNDRREGGERRSFNSDRPERRSNDRGGYNSDRRDESRGGERTERRSFGTDRPDRREGGERRSFGDRREGGERRSLGGDRPDRREGGERGAFGNDRPRRDEGERRSFGAGRNEGGERRKFEPKREGGDRKPYGVDRREGGDRPFNREGKSFYSEKRSFGGDRGAKGKSFGDRDRSSSFGESKGEAPQTPNYNLSRYKDNPRIKKTNRKEEGEEDGTIRLNRFIANAGICSRREADLLIEAGEIKVNGEVITEMGYKVQPTDNVQYGKKILNREKLVYVLLNKPKDFLTTTDDPEGRKTVMDLVANASTERIFPVGRLDRNTTGLLLFTNDGELAQKLTHPSNGIKKIYQVELDKPLTKEDFKTIAEGVELEDGKAEVDDVAILGESNKFVGIEIHIGRNRIVRRIFEHLGYDVVTLDRVQYASLTKKDLPRSNWRYLSEKEVVRLKYFM
ncbi:pseudouridine synthase [Pontibacter diazotrophicus]|uniref:Pseudouridine synthase n=1 Tax=Pontibacter diazotrophicus TaxID=1400979 RepID=A0A3D8LA98_9BACT|nr:pseudouridine synthase [Pontibacter diazotrophicus]RDV14349.1 pseudouridine synthase [Pontibacter diazotrophicus]